MKINLPVMYREEYDHSMLETHDECPQKFFYKYVLNRASVGTNYPITNGNIFHHFMYLLNTWAIDNPGEIPLDGLVQAMQAEAINKYWTGDPPSTHKHSWMTLIRIETTLKEGYKYWLQERMVSNRQTIRAEEPFLLLLPNGKKYGGRIDELLLWNNRLWMRDYKTTSQMGVTYSDKFDPANQFTGYIWGSSELSSTRVYGAIIRTVYNTKNQGPTLHENIATRSEGQIERFLTSTMQKIADIERHFETGVFPMNTNACSNWGGCAYREACKKSSDGEIETWLLGNTTEIVWDFTNPDNDKSVD